MKDKWLARAVQFVEIVLNFLVTLALLLALFTHLPADQPGVFRILLLLLVPLLDWALRIWIGNFFLFIALTILLGGAIVILIAAGPVQQVIFGLTAMIYAIRSFSVRIGKQEENEGLLGPAFSLAVTGGGFFISAYRGADRVCYHIVNIALLFVFLYFIYRYLSRFTGYIHTNQSSAAHVPVKEMFGKGISMILVYGLFAVLILGVFAGNGLTQGVTEVLRKAVFWLLQKIFWLLSLLFTDSVEEETIQSGASVQIAEILGEAKEAPAWIQYLETILVNAVLAAVVAFLCFMAYRGVMAALRNFRRKKKGVIAEYQDEEIKRERLKKGDGADRKEKALSFFARTPEEKIRKSYIKAVRKLFRNPQKNSETVRELEERVSIEEPQEFIRLGRLYEKARYGPQSMDQQRTGTDNCSTVGCTRQEAKEAAEITAHILHANRK